MGDCELYLENNFDTPEELLEFFRQPDFQPDRLFAATFRGKCGWIFRGHSDSTWPLVPSAHRKGNPLSRFTPQTPGGKQPRNSRRVSHLGMQLHAELRAVHLFLEHADKLGIPTPIDYGSVNEHLELINAALNQREYDYSLEFPSQKLVAGIALAQHYGVPTRLLDWTESPFVAAYFAAAGASRTLGKSPKKRNSGKRISVVYLYTTMLDKLGGLRVAQAPRHANNFLRVQQGLFTYLPSANEWYIQNRKWPSIEDVYRETRQSRGWLRRATIPQEKADDLLRLLWSEDITRHHLMPNLENAATAFQCLFRNLSGYCSSVAGNT